MKVCGFYIGTVHVPTRVIMAPMAGLTNFPFRIIAAELGCPTFWTEMISAEGMFRNKPETLRLLPSHADPHPIAAQIFGADESVLSEAAVIAEKSGADIVDINMACPVRRISGSGAGAALMKDPRKAYRVVRSISDRLSIPVTVKIRAGWDANRINALEVGRSVEAAGASALIIHGRTRSQAFSGSAQHHLAIPLVKALDIPIIISGDITNGKQAARVLNDSGAAAVMIGRASIGNPWIFHAISRYLEDGHQTGNPSDEEKLRVMIKHLGLLEKHFGPKRGLCLFKSHLSAYLKGRSNASRWRGKLLRESQAVLLKKALREIFRDSG